MMLRLVLLSLTLISPAMAQRIPVPPERPASIPRGEEPQSPAEVRQPPPPPTQATTQSTAAPVQAQTPQISAPPSTAASQSPPFPFQTAIIVIVILVFGGLILKKKQDHRRSELQRKSESLAAAPVGQATPPAPQPHISVQPQTARRLGCFPTILFTLAGIIGLLALINLMTDVTMTPERRAELNAQQESQRIANQIRRDMQDLEFRAKEIIRQSLRDPSSAQFRNVFTLLGSNTVCGEVNARNAFGGLTGFQPFVVTQGAPFIREGSRQQIAQFEALFRTACALPLTR
jgi:hypothetical protein